MVSSGMHRGMRPRMDDLLWTKRPWSGSSAEQTPVGAAMHESQLGPATLKHQQAKLTFRRTPTPEFFDTGVKLSLALATAGRRHRQITAERF
jgi:hypothetical protein